MDNHKKKMVAPVIITIVFVGYLLVYLIFALTAAAFQPFMVLFALPIAALGIGMVYVLKSRINEIRSGEEDDLSNY